MKRFSVSTVRAFNSIIPEKEITIYVSTNFRLVKRVLFDLYLSEGMGYREACLLSSRDAARNGPYTKGKKSSSDSVDMFREEVFLDEAYPYEYVVLKNRRHKA